MLVTGPLTRAEHDRLWWQLMKALAAVIDEIGKLERIPAAVRDLCYGRDVLGQFYGVRDDIADLVADETDLAQGDPGTVTVRK